MIYQTSSLTIRLPAWAESLLPLTKDPLPRLEDRMAKIIKWSRMNVEHGTGGPFAAAIYDQKGRLISLGLNLVLSGGSSILHAEIVAIALAQARLSRWDLSLGGQDRFEIVSSCEPCAMCQGAIGWSGLRRLSFGALDQDARAVGFDEGVKAPDWIDRFREREIEVQGGILRDQAAIVLRDYAAQGGIVYNPGHKSDDW